MRNPKFKCEYCNKTEYTIKDKIAIADCCKKEFSIDYLYLYEEKTLLYSR